MDTVKSDNYDAEKKELVNRRYITATIGLLGAGGAFAGGYMFMEKTAKTLGGMLAAIGGAVMIYAGYKGNQIQMDMEEFHRKRNAEHLANTLQTAQTQGSQITPAVAATIAVEQQRADEEERWQKRTGQAKHHATGATRE